MAENLSYSEQRGEFKTLTEKITSIEKKIDDLSEVTVMNGNDMPVTRPLKNFFQMIYDNYKELNKDKNFREQNRERVMEATKYVEEIRRKESDREKEKTKERDDVKYWVILLGGISAIATVLNIIF